MPSYFCIECGRPTRHFNIKAAAEHCEVTRATIYNWIHRGLVHCVIQPSGRKFLCEESLLVPGFSVYSPSWQEQSAWPSVHQPGGRGPGDGPVHAISASPLRR